MLTSEYPCDHEGCSHVFVIVIEGASQALLDTESGRAMLAELETNVLEDARTEHNRMCHEVA